MPSDPDSFAVTVFLYCGFVRPRDGIGSIWVRIWHQTGLDPRYCRLKLDPGFPGLGIILTLFRPGFLVNGHGIELSPTLAGFLTFKPESTKYRPIFRPGVMK